MRVLMAVEDEHHAYLDAIAGAIQAQRPHLDLAVAGLGALEKESSRRVSQMVICSQLPSTVPRNWLAWVELSLDPGQPSKMCVGQRCSKMCNPTLDDLISVVDEAEEMMSGG